METKVLIAQIDKLCEKAGCQGKKREVHREQYIVRRWNPHPPEDFVSWWKAHHEFRTSGTTELTAFNCDRIRRQWKEHKCREAARAA